MSSTVEATRDLRLTTEQTRALIAGYIKIMDRKIQRYGWNAYLVTFMFNQIPGGRTVRLKGMSDTLNRFYATFLTRVVRRPQSPFQLSERPLFITLPDYPVPKHDKQRLADITTNGGLHMHAILAVPWQSRLKQDVITHVDRYARLYVKEPLSRIHIGLIENNLNRVGDYVFKSIKRGRCDWDDVIVLPKSTAEVRNRSEAYKKMVKLMSSFDL
jgi:hypothetical protein